MPENKKINILMNKERKKELKLVGQIFHYHKLNE